MEYTYDDQNGDQTVGHLQLLFRRHLKSFQKTKW